MDSADFFANIVQPSLKRLEAWTGVASGQDAQVLVMAIAGQEGNWQFRQQIGGPARSYWQFEEGGGVHGLFKVAAVKLHSICSALDIPYEEDSVFQAMTWNDTLACCMARLLLWTDVRPLPAVGDIEGGWNYYRDNWRPGAPHYATWPTRYGVALSVVRR